jgi:hypothetical protein
MKHPLLCLIWFLFSHTMVAQNSDSIPFVQGVPMEGEDSAQAVPHYDQFPYDQVRLLKAEDLPVAVQKELNENELFSGWRSDARIEFDKNTTLYWIHFSDSGRVRSYAFNSRGAPVSIREKNDTVNINNQK